MFVLSSCLVLSWLGLSWLVLSWLVFSCLGRLFLSCLGLSCLGLSCLGLSCLGLACLGLACLGLSCLLVGLSCLVFFLSCLVSALSLPRLSLFYLVLFYSVSFIVWASCCHSLLILILITRWRMLSHASSWTPIGWTGTRVRSCIVLSFHLVLYLFVSFSLVFVLSFLGLSCVLVLSLPLSGHSCRA